MKINWFVRVAARDSNFVVPHYIHGRITLETLLMNQYLSLSLSRSTSSCNIILECMHTSEV